MRSAPDGTLWVGSGDASSFNDVDPLAFRTYNTQSMAGKIMHIDRNGQGLPGHPFCTANGNLSQVCTKIWAGGFRNPFRFKLRPGGGLTVGDVGWGTTEEVDFVPDRLRRRPALRLALLRGQRPHGRLPGPRGGLRSGVREGGHAPGAPSPRAPVPAQQLRRRR